MHGEVQTLQASPVPTGKMNDSIPSSSNKSCDTVKNINQSGSNEGSSSTKGAVHVRVNSDVNIVSASVSTPPKLRMPSSGKGANQSSTVTPSSFAPGSPIEASTSVHGEFNFDTRASPALPSSVEAKNGKTSPFPLSATNPLNASKSNNAPPQHSQRSQFGGFVSRRGRSQGNSATSMSRNMFGNNSNNPPAPFMPRSSMPPPPSHSSGAALSPPKPQSMLSQSQETIENQEKNSDILRKSLEEVVIKSESSTENVEHTVSSEHQVSSSNIFEQDPTGTDQVQSEDDAQSTIRSRSPPALSVCFADGNEKEEESDNYFERKYMGSFLSAPNTPGNGDFKIDLKSPCHFSPFMSVDPNSPTFQMSRLTPIAAGRNSGLGAGVFSLIKSPTTSQRTPKGGFSLSTPGIDLRTPTTMGLLNGSFDTPNANKCMDTPSFSWLQSPPPGILSGDVCGTTPVSHFFKEVGGLDLEETPKPEQADRSDEGEPEDDSEGKGSDPKRNSLAQRRKSTSAMQNHFSQICISPLASSKKGGPHFGHALAYMRSPKSPKRPGGYSLKFSSSPLNVNMEKELTDDEDLSILLNLASSSTQGTVFRSPVVQQQQQHYQKLSARDVPKASLQLPAISSSDAKSSPKLTRKTPKDHVGASSAAQPPPPPPSHHYGVPPPQSYHTSHAHNTRNNRPLSAKRRTSLEETTMPQYPQPLGSHPPGPVMSRGGSISTVLGGSGSSQRGASPYGHPPTNGPPPPHPGQSYGAHAHPLHPPPSYQAQIKSSPDSASKIKKRGSPKKKAQGSPSKKPKTSSPPVDAKEKAAAASQALAMAGTSQGSAAQLAAAIMRGVTMRPSGKWQAQLYYAGKSRYIGVFDSREKAALAYEIAREQLKTDVKETMNQDAKTTEDKVNAARKAAFAGVNEPDPKNPSKKK